jgi:hypothetical protein
VKRLPEPVQEIATDGLRDWAKYRGLRRQLRRDLADVAGGGVPRSVRRQWEQSVRAEMEATG